MIKSILFFLLLFMVPVLLSAQTSDMIVLRKKNNKTDRTLFKGMIAEFGTVDGYWMSGQITNIQRDTIFLNYFDIRRVPNQFGTFTMDTIARLPAAVYYKDVRTFKRKKMPFFFIRNGTLLKVGSAGYILLNVINGKYLGESLGDNRNMKSLSIAAGVFGVGFLMGKITKSTIVVGKKYRLVYISLNK